MPVYKIRIEQEIQQSGYVKIWAPDKDYIHDNRTEILGEAAEFVDFEDDDYDTTMGTIEETPESRDAVDEELVFGFIPEEYEAEQEVPVVLPGQLALEGI